MQTQACTVAQKEKLFQHHFLANREYGTGTLAHGKLYLAGKSANSRCFDLHTKSFCKWHLYQEVSFAPLVSCEEYGVICRFFGSSSGYMSFIQVYDIKTQQWTHFQIQGTNPRAGHCCAYFNGKCYAFGGYDGSRFNSEMVEFDIVTKQVQIYGTENVKGKSAATLVPYNGELILYGGNADGIDTYEDVFAFHVINKTWRKLAISEHGYKPSGRYYHSAVMVSHYMFVYGGEANSQVLNHLFYLDMHTLIWHIVDESMVPLSYHSLVLHNKNELLVFGGKNPKQDWNDELMSIRLNIPHVPLFAKKVKAYADVQFEYNWF